jgi:adenylate cyclase
MFVISAETSRSITSHGTQPEAQANALGVAFAVSGAVRQENDGVLVTVDLVRAGTGKVVWSRRYDQQGEDPFAIQDDMVRGIASALNVPLNDREIRTVNRIPTSNLEAWDFFLRAEYQTVGLGEADSLRRALVSYQRAFELDPEFAEAYAGYARVAATVWRRDFSEIMSGAVARHRAYEAAGKAMQLDPENARAYEVLSIIQAVDGEHQIAVRSARQAVDFQPGDAESHANLATVLYFAGDLDSAAAEVGVAKRLNPGLSTDLRLTSAMVNFARHQYPDAIAELDSVLQSVPRRSSKSRPGSTRRLIPVRVGRGSRHGNRSWRTVSRAIRTGKPRQDQYGTRGRTRTDKPCGGGF